ncbi:AraC family transcriptional regulator [Streptomyces sp. NPDC054932]
MSPAFTSSSALDGGITSRPFGFLSVSTVQGAPQRLVGPPRPGRSAPCDPIGVGLHTKGSAVIVQHDRAQRCEVGDVFLVDLAHPYAVREHEDFRLHLFRLPRAALGLAEEAGDLPWGVHAPGADSVVRLLAPLLVTLAEAVETYPRDVAHRLAGTVTDLLATLASGATSSARTAHGAVDANGGRVDLARRVRSFVNQNLGDRDLSPEMIAAHHHVSVRHLHKVFVNEGMTLGRWIQQRRLEECRRELARCGRPAVSVAAVARRWGYVNPGHFSRSFRAAYGISPSEWHRIRGVPDSAAGPEGTTQAAAAGARPLAG